MCSRRHDVKCVTVALANQAHYNRLSRFAADSERLKRSSKGTRTPIDICRVLCLLLAWCRGLPGGQNDVFFPSCRAESIRRAPSLTV